MPTINVSGAGASGGGGGEQTPPVQKTPQQLLADAVSSGRKLQAANRQIADFFGSIGEGTRKAFDEIADKQRATENALQADEAKRDREARTAANKQAQKDRDQAEYLRRVRQTSMAWIDRDREKEARQAKRDTEQQARKQEKNESYLRRVRMTSMKWEEDAKEKAARDAERVQQQAQAQRHARVRNFARLARTTAMVVNGIHGDVEGVSAGVGGLLGGAIGGAPGAEIGEVIGEVVAKVGKAILTAPLALGNMWNGYMATSQPYFAPQRQAADLGGAGGFRGDDLFDSLRQPGKFSAAPFMAYYGRTQSEALSMLNDVGVSPRSAGAGTSMIKDMFATGYTPGFRGLGDGAITGTLGQGLNAGLTSPAGSLKYLSQFGNVLQKGIPLDIDRSKLLTRMTDAIETMVKGGGAANAGDLTEMFSRFMMAGGPGRGGEDAANNAASITGTLNNLSGSTGTLYNFQRIAGKYNNFKTDGDIQAALGPEAWENLQNRPASGAIIARIKAGNLYTQSKIMGPLFGDQRYQDLTADLNSGLPIGIRDTVTAGAAGGSVLGTISDQYGRQQGAIGKSVMGGYNPIHRGPDAQEAAMAAKVASGTATAEETAWLLRQYGLPEENIPSVMAEAKKTGSNPMLWAIEAFHESNFKSHPKDQVNITKSGRLNIDRGIFQISNQHDGEDPFQLDRYAPDYQARKLGQVITGFGKYGADLKRANPLDPGWVNWQKDQVDAWGGGQGNIPVENRYRANADSSSVEGAKTYSEQFGGSMIKLTQTVDSAVTSVQNFIKALDSFSGGQKNIPDAPTDLGSRLGRFAGRAGEAYAGMGALGALP